MVDLSRGVSKHGVDAIGYIGGALLAGCFLPQIYQVVTSRSVHDISIAWSLLYSSGLTLTTVYLMFKDAPAAWIPSLFELIGGLLVLFLKLFFEHTATGRRMCAERQQEQQEGQEQPGKEADDKSEHDPVTPRTHTCNTLSAFGSGRFASIYNVTFSAGSTGSTPRGSLAGLSMFGARSRASLDEPVTLAHGPNLRINTALSADASSISLSVADSANSIAAQQSEPAGQPLSSPGALQSPKCVLRLPTQRLRGAGQAGPRSSHVSFQGSFRDHGLQPTPSHLAPGLPADETDQHVQTGAAQAHTPKTPRQGRLMWSSSMSDPGRKPAQQ